MFNKDSLIMIQKTLLMLSVASVFAYADTAVSTATSAPTASTQTTSVDEKGAEPKLELPKELETVPVKASDDEMKKFEAMLENVMKSEKGIEIMQKLQLRAQYTEAKHEQETRDLLDTHKDKLINEENAIVLGNPKGTVTLVLVADPLCPNCRVLESMLRKIVKQQPSLKVVTHQWAFVNPEESARVSRFLQAAYTVDAKSFGKLQDGFLALKSVPNEKTMDDLIVGAKYDLQKVKDVANSEAAKAKVEGTRDLAKQLKFPGAPILMAKDPEGRLLLIPPVSEQDLTKIISDLGKAVSGMPASKTDKTTAAAAA